MTAPERIWIDAWGGNWSPQAGGTQGIEYVRADLAAVQPAQVRVKPLDIAYVQRHAFLSGVVAARNVPSHEPINGHALWLDYDPGDNPALSRILAALEPQPDPRDEVLNQAMKDAITMGEGWIRTIQDGTLQLIDPSAVRLMPDATDPRDEVIKGLVEAATDAAEAIDMAYGSDDDESPHRHSAKLRAALAAAKAVQHG